MRADHVITISREQIRPDPENLRKEFDEEELRALADNLRVHGQMDPIQVFRRPDGYYDLLDGERRWRASALAGLTQLSAIVVPRPSDTDLLCKKISRFMQTKTLSFPEEVRALESGLRALGVLENESDWPRAAKKLGVPLGTLRERMRVHKLIPELRQQFEDGKLDYTVSQSVGRISDPKRQKEATEFIAKEGLSNRFVTTQFIPALLDEGNRKKSLIEIYDLARQRERFRYASPRKVEEVPEAIVDRIDDLLADLRRSIAWMEAAARQDLIGHLTPTNFNTRRVVTTVRHLWAIQGAFLSAFQARYGKEPAAGRRKIRTTKELLLEGPEKSSENSEQ